MNEDEKINEFNDIDLLNQLINLKNNLENYLNEKKINYDDFMNYFCEYYYEFLKDFDYMKSKEKFYNLFEGLLKNEYKEQTFNNIETNIYTSMTCNPNFKNENLKYLLTATQYPNIELLKKSISLYAKKSLPILEVFVSIDMKNSNIWKLSHIEIINDFINSFSEENSNLITRNSSKSDRIELYLNEIRNRNRSLLDENGNSPLDIQFMKFCDSYSEITNITPSNINRDSLVGYILNDNKIENEKSTINKIYCHLIDIQNEFLNKIIEKYNKYKEKELKDDIIIKNVTEQIQKEIPIQLATKTDIISFDVSNNIILSFEELFSFYSLKNIFNEKDNKIDYSKYSQIKFKLNMIEKDLANIILTGKKIFSKKQITYKFYLDPYEVEEKTKQFQKFTELYDKEELNEGEKEQFYKEARNLERIILPNLEILIYYLIKENKYQGKQKINEVNFHSNLYLNINFIHLFKDNNNLTINKLVSIYEFMEEKLWEKISDRYIIDEFKKIGFSDKNKSKLDNYFDNEKKRNLKNDMIIYLLIKFICRYLPYMSKEDKTRDLFEMLREKNMYLSENILKDLEDFKKEFAANVSDTINLTLYFVRKKGMNIKKINNPKKADDFIEKIKEENIKKKVDEKIDDNSDDDEDSRDLNPGKDSESEDNGDSEDNEKERDL